MSHGRMLVWLLVVLTGWGLPLRGRAQDLQAQRPIAGIDSVFLEELTWMEVRDAVRAGKSTVIVSTGGLEPNGPYVAIGKHNYVLQTVLPYIARAIPNSLLAPIVKFVPEGQIEPTSGHMNYPGTISLEETTFEALLTDIRIGTAQLTLDAGRIGSISLGQSLLLRQIDETVSSGELAPGQQVMLELAEQADVHRVRESVVTLVPDQLSLDQEGLAAALDRDRAQRTLGTQRFQPSGSNNPATVLASGAASER